MEQDLPPGDLGSNAGLGPTPPLPRKKPAVFHHPTLDMPLYDGLAMDLHAMTYAEPLFAEIVRLRADAERYRWLSEQATQQADANGPIFRISVRRSEDRTLFSLSAAIDAAIKETP